ncbi:MAG TPA: hypothetical protein VLK82_27130 [Candidatus Tectomicrobia bacterium]|nr:hypothetical protein [Candidatus Tectomicrobia bacterium]
MPKYLLRRLLITVPTLVGTSAVLFTILALAPGVPSEELALNPNIRAEVRLNLRHQFGLGDPIPARHRRGTVALLADETARPPGYCLTNSGSASMLSHREAHLPWFLPGGQMMVACEAREI